MAEDIDLIAYRKAYGLATEEGYSSVSGDLFAEFVVSNYLDRPDPAGWDNLRGALRDWEVRQMEIGA